MGYGFLLLTPTSTLQGVDEVVDRVKCKGTHINSITAICEPPSCAGFMVLVLDRLHELIAAFSRDDLIKKCCRASPCGQHGDCLFAHASMS